MLASLASSFRSFQASLLCGAMMALTVYIFFGSLIEKVTHPRAPLQILIHASVYVPLVGILLVCLMLGSLYTTALEGIVDAVHRHTLIRDNTTSNRVLRWLWKSTAPLSDSARKRLTFEAGLFYDDNATLSSLRSGSRVDFIDRVITDTLWMEGKLVGTPLLKQYDAFRSEGEIQTSSSILIPATAAAVAYGLGLSPAYCALIAVASVPIALKILDYGLYYYRRANSLIAHHVADGTVLSPTMESLRRGSLEGRGERLNPSPAVISDLSPEVLSEALRNIDDKLESGES